MGIESTMATPLAEAVRRAGGQSPFARMIGRNQSTVFDWLRLQKPLPAELVRVVERETGVSSHVLRPDIFSPADVPVTPPGEDASVAPGEPIPSCDRPAISQRSARR